MAVHHDHGTSDSRRRVGFAFVLTFTFMLVEIAGGILSGSLALLADAGHMLADAGALALAWAGFRLAERPSDDRRSYGYARFQVLAAYTNGIVLLGVAGWIVIEAMGRLVAPGNILAVPMLVVALVGLGVNLVVFTILHRGDRGNLNLRGAMLHVLGDMLGSAAAAVAAVVILFTGWVAIDSILSVFVAGLVIWAAIGLLRQSGHILLEGTPVAFDTAEIRETLVRAVPEVRDVHHLHVWSLTERHPLATLHAVVGEGADINAVQRGIRAVMAAEYGLDHITVQVEVGGCPDHG